MGVFGHRTPPRLLLPGPQSAHDQTCAHKIEKQEDEAAEAEDQKRGRAVLGFYQAVRGARGEF